jgi:hypothetical protein
MYFSTYTASQALRILARAGFSAEAVSASRPVTGVRYLMSVEAPHLPRLDGKVRTVQLRTPEELIGWGASQHEVDGMHRADEAGLG